MRRFLGYNLWAAFAVGSSIQCADEQGACADGSEGCACVDGACLGDLKCLSGFCVADDAGGTTGPDDPTSSGATVTATASASEGDPTTSTTNPTSTTGAPTACGNGVLDAGEQCDDGNAVNNDACDNECDETPKGILLLPEYPTGVYGALVGTSETRVCDLSVLVEVTAYHANNHFLQIDGACGVLELVPKGDGFAVEITPGAELEVIGFDDDGVSMPSACPKDHVLVSFSGSYAVWLSSLVFQCAPIVVEKVDGEYTIHPGTPVPLPMVGDVDRLLIDEKDCSSGRVFNGYVVGINFDIYSFGAGCTSMHLTY